MAADEIIVKLTAQTDQLKAGLAESAAAVKASTDAMTASAKGYTDVTADLIAAQNAAMSHAVEYMDVQKQVAPVIKETEVASNGLAAALTRNSRTAYSASALISDALTGQFSRSRREIAALGNETGVMAKALTFALSPIGLLTGALVGLGVGVLKVQDHYDKFEQTILRTGNIIGMSAGELQTMSDDIGEMTGHTFEAVDAVQALGASGRFTGGELRIAAEAAVNFSEVTGEKVGEAAKIIESLQENPAKAIAKVNDEFHFLTQSQADLIEKLLNTGQSAQAATVAVQAFHDAMANRAGEMEADASALSRAWGGVSNSIQQAAEHLAEYIEVSTGGGDTAEKLAVAKRELDAMTAGTAEEHKALLASGNAEIIQQEKLVAQLELRKRAEDSIAAGQAAAARATAEQFDKATHSGKHGGSGSADEEAFQQAQYDAQRQGHEMSLAEQKAWWQKRLETDKAGGAAEANATAAAMRHVVELQKQIEREGAAESRKTASQREQEDRGVARAREQTLHELADEIKKESDQEIALARETAQQKEKLAIDDAVNAGKGAQLAFAQGKITQQQLVAIEIQSVQQKLAAETAFYTALAKLDEGNVLKVSQDQFEIVDAIKKSEAQITEIKKQALSEQDREQKRFQQVTEGAVTSQVNAMIFQNQRLRAALANIAESVAETWIANEIKTVIFHDGAEQGKTAASLAGAAARTAADTAGQAESLAVQGATAVKWIMTEAAKAAASAFNALAAIPVVGPALAVGASIAAFATVAALVSNVASAEGGWERVPADGMQTVLHRDEMVLPKHVADPIRNMAKSGSSGGTVHNHFHVNAWDGKTTKDFLRRNPNAFADALGHARRNGW